jgi:hypothetical protein
MPLAQFRVDDGPHNMDGLRLFAQDGAERVEASVGRLVEVLFSDITESGEDLNLTELVREPLPPAFHGK